MTKSKYIHKKKEFGDYQTPEDLALAVCEKLKHLNITANTILEPTCGIGAFILAGHKIYPDANILGFEINPDYVIESKKYLSNIKHSSINIELADFFATDWDKVINGISGKLLVLGNLPWVTNSAQGFLKSSNLPLKSNFLKLKGFDAISGKSNFDISEWMLIECISWFQKRDGSIAMLVKTAVARKVIAYAKKIKAPVIKAAIYKIDAKFFFNASVDACLLVLEFSLKVNSDYDYKVYNDLDCNSPVTIGHRDGLTISNLDKYNNYKHLLGKSKFKWRSGIKHDSSSIMELTRQGKVYINGLKEIVDIEPDLLFPLMKGSDIGTNKKWREKFVIVTQQNTGTDTSYIKHLYPKTWDYLMSHVDQLDARKSIIYRNSPRFAIFGVGEYSFRPWKIAICSLYKSLSFKLIPSIDNKPVQFDDTVYFISFNSQIEAENALRYLQSKPVQNILNSLIFWDDKRPIKTSILNLLNWRYSDFFKDSQPPVTQYRLI